MQKQSCWPSRVSASNCHGVILIEWMLALAIGLLVMSGLWEIYFTAQKNFRLQESINFIQDSATTASHLLVAAIQQAGFIGCAKLTADFPLYAKKQDIITPQNKLIITDTEITVKHAANIGAELMRPAQKTAEIITSDNIHFNPFTRVVIADCFHAEIMWIKRVVRMRDGVQKLILTEPLQGDFQAHAEVSKLVNNRYFVMKSALYVEDINKRKTRLVDGVDSLHVKTVANNLGLMIELVVSSPPLRKVWYVYAPF